MVEALNSKSIQENNKQFFVKNTKAKMALQKLLQTKKQLEMLFTKGVGQGPHFYKFKSGKLVE